MLGFLIFQDIRRPFRFKKEVAARKAVVVARMSELKSAQDLFYQRTNRFTRNYDSLYHVVKLDSVFLQRPDFSMDSLKFIPYSKGIKFELKDPVTDSSGMKTFDLEIRAPFSAFLKGLDKQMVGSVIKEKKDSNLYPGLVVKLVPAKEP
jgi:hypothetical protein